MSTTTPTQNHIFLPNYILEYVVEDQDNPRLDPNLFLSKASTSQIVEVIMSFYPHLRFTENARQDHELILKVFVEMVAPRLSNIIIPFNRNTDYLQAMLRTPIHQLQPLARSVNSSADIDTRRIERFEVFCLPNLKTGRYRLAADDLKNFVKDYKHLQQVEIDEIVFLQDDAQDLIHDVTSNLQRTHDSIEIIQLQLRNPNLSPTERQDLEERSKSANPLLISHQRAFDDAIKDAALLHALARYHINIRDKHSAGPSN
ncbi:uncharacterized protein MELLADRAFT_89762 [Melampsora larici-populina 98AG31]|uniref:Uncharacterized protein n=1 Tax=Melampsora larici-populina (strain 98AG31 / pathotype 3-4-7) TaxID=747676 RepID=F4RUI9_MELLP|nr:uncharacterized protein MELLADRAFT_89762 [Melampsora larici-populina 98AG31]EGG03943.1 hypothetical protein MELLADRAFT_89762 [Melampsora larici-populina 98AG31]